MPITSNPCGLLGRMLVIALLAAMIIVWFPVDRVYADNVAPETKQARLDPVTGESDEYEFDDPLEAPNGADGTGGAMHPDASVSSEVGTSEVLESPFAFSMAGVRGVGEGEVSVRWRGAAGDWSAWTGVEKLEEIDGPDDGTAEDSSAEALQADGWIGEPHWVGEATALQVSIAGGALDDVEIHVIDSMGHSESLFEQVGRQLRGLTTTAPAEAADPSSIVTRSEWGADESIRRGSPSYTQPRFAVVHHTAGTNNYTRSEAPGIVRGIYSWHVKGNGWSDIGYNLLVDRYGTVYEGRYGGIDRGVVGAHARNFNSGSIGITIMGNFEVASPPAAAVTAMADVMAWKFAVHGIDPTPGATTTHNGRTINRIIGHRDVGATACPGQFLYGQLAAIADRVHSQVSEYAAGWTPVAGDWDGSGTDTVGWYKDGQWRLYSDNSSTSSVASFRYGEKGDLPIVGDWNGDGRTTVGVVREGRWLLRNSNRAGDPEIAFWYGRGGIDFPMAGDWNANGRDGPAIIRDGEWHLRNTLSGGSGQIVFTYGRILEGDLPLVGDWNGSGHETPAILRNGEWHLRNSHSGGPADLTFTYGRLTRGDLPVAGDWNGSGSTGIGVTRGGHWHLRHTLSGGPAELSFFGL